jgi:rhamnosyltransferase
MKKDIAALVILYNYGVKCIENIRSYSNQVNVVYAYDNTEDINKSRELELQLNTIPNLVYINGHGNQGLSCAINKVGWMTIRKGYKWLVTFDQDSAAYENMVEKMDLFAQGFDNNDNIGIISPIIKEQELKYSQPVYPYSYVDWVIQSGAMHNLNTFKKIKGYDENIFIHQVDTDYCYRLTDNGYKIVRLNNAVLIHNVSDGEVKLKYLHGRKIYTNKFSPMRYYYIMRNNLYCLFKYRSKNKIFCADLKRNTEILLQTWILEEKKGARARAMFYGLMDFMLGNMGKTKRKF